MKDRISRAIEFNENLSTAVLQLSDQYTTQEGSLTPWSVNALADAYLAYFMPLNAARLKNAWHEVERFLISEVRQVWDIGSGPGTFQWMLEEQWPKSQELHCVERAPEAVRLHRQLISESDKWRPVWHASLPKQTEPGALGVFSYSLLELKNPEQIVAAFDHLLIVEPATHTRGRELMRLRKILLSQGYHALAPCTHESACPLLEKSDRDWCHQRFLWQAPEWWQSLQDQLPMKNNSLTYSYLLMSRTHKPSEKYFGRVIGDTLYERGKVRQMFCRGPEREFLSWLTRNGEPPPIPHGALVKEMPPFEVKSTELRLDPQLHITIET